MEKKKQQPEKKARRRVRGSGSVYVKTHRPGCDRERCTCVRWVAYVGLDGRRHTESAGSHRKGDAERLLRQRLGAIDKGMPTSPDVGRITVGEAARALFQDYAHRERRSLGDARRRVEKHLAAFFGTARRLASIDTAAVRDYIAHRQAEGIVAARGPRKGERVADVSNAQVNRELSLLRRMFRLAVQDGRLHHVPHIPMLGERNARTGFFEPDQVQAVLANLPPPLRPVVEFAYITGWRVHSEVLPLEWRNVDFRSGEVRLDRHATKNDEPRVFVMTARLRTLLEAQRDARDRWRKAGHVASRVFCREVAEGRGGPKRPQPIVAFGKAWKAACRKAGVPGRIPHDLRRTAVRNLVRAGIPERVAMQLSGHKTRSVFERYNIVSGGDLREAARKLDAVAQ